MKCSYVFRLGLEIAAVFCLYFWLIYELSDLKSFVLKMGDSYQVITKAFVNVIISTTAKTNVHLERRFDKGITVEELKAKLELLTGGRCNTMKVELYSARDEFMCSLEPDTALLGSFPIDDGMRLHVIDNFEMRQEFEDFAKVEKFELSEEEYAKKQDTLKAYLAKNKLGKYNEEEMKMREEMKKKEEEEEKALAESIKPESRCEVRIFGQPKKRGTVMYSGQVDFSSGYWIGVKYDEPLGKNNGTVAGKSYFVCPPNYGGFVKPTNVHVGDYPEEEYDFEEM